MNDTSLKIKSKMFPFIASYFVVNFMPKEAVV